MQRKLLLAALVALAVLGGCAQRDPNLLVRALSEGGRTAGDYTLSLKTYELDAEGRAKLAGPAGSSVGSEDASLRGFITRTLSAKGYTLKASGPVRYAVEAHLLCADTRKASLGLLHEELRLPEAAVGAGYSKDIHYWLPNAGVGPGQAGKDALDLRDATQRRFSSGTFDRASQANYGGAPLGGKDNTHCQGRVLVTLTPSEPGPQRVVFVGRGATDDCPDVPECPLGTCRTALERVLVDVLENAL